MASAASVVLPGAYPKHIANPSAASWAAPTGGITGAYSAAVSQNAADYDKIMGNYGTLFDQAQKNVNKTPISYNPIQAETIGPYTPSAGMQDVSRRLTQFADTGGFLNNELAAFRGRGLAPIRSIYSSALRNLARQKSIQGGYSPNYGALQAKLAREQSGILSQKSIDLEAEIADKVAEGRRFGLGTLAPLAARESELAHNVGILNAGAKNRVNELNATLGLDTSKFNASNLSDSISQALAANQGMANLYGTTPALTNTFGSQLLSSNAQNLNGQQAIANTRQQRANTGLQTISAAQSAPPTYSTSTSSNKLTPQNAYSSGFLLSPQPTQPFNRYVSAMSNPNTVFNYSGAPRLG